MKICIVSDFFVPHYSGGGEIRYFEIAKRLVEKGHQVDVICMKIAQAELSEEIAGINVHHIGPTIENPPQRSGIDFIRFMGAVFHWILTHDYDIIDAQTYAPLIPAFLSAKLKRIPIIGTIHDVSSGEDDQWLQSSRTAAFAEKILARLPYDKIITVSNATKKALVKYYGTKDERIEVVYNGVDLALIDSVNVEEKQEHSLIFVGRLAPHKHVDHILEVLKLLKNEIPDIKLKIVGNGIEKENLMQLTATWGLEDSVIFLHDLSYLEVIAEMKKSTVLVLPSTREGFGMVLAEANACEIPVIAYSSGGVVEVVQDAYNGFLVTAGDLENLEKKIQFLLNDPADGIKMGKNGRNNVETYFTWDIIVEEILKVYNSIRRN